MPFTSPSTPNWDGVYHVGLSKLYPTGSTEPDVEETTVSFLTEWRPWIGGALTEEQLDSVFDQFRSDMIAAGFEVNCQKYYASQSIHTPAEPE